MPFPDDVNKFIKYEQGLHGVHEIRFNILGLKIKGKGSLRNYSTKLCIYNVYLFFCYQVGPDCPIHAPKADGQSLNPTHRKILTVYNLSPYQDALASQVVYGKKTQLMEVYVQWLDDDDRIKRIY